MCGMARRPGSRDPEELEHWQAWLPLATAAADGRLPSRLGLYRVRRIGCSGLDYIGQTGIGTMTLRRRISMLREVYGPVMPYRDPHTAAPGLWALRNQGGCDFEVSVMVVDGITQWRRTLEVVAITLYRLEHGRSPTLNFGRMPVGYLMSSGNNAGLVVRGRRFRGGPTTERSTSHLPSLPPMTSAFGASISSGWGGHSWQPWVQLRGLRVSTDSVGLYRVRDPNQTGLVYVGQGRIMIRLMAHLAKASRPEHPQAHWFGTPGLECSWTANSCWLAHQRLELENDLIGAHFLEHGLPPSAQFLD
jgi:hypothetical protein